MMHRGVNIARNREIDDEERTVPACSQNGLELLSSQNCVRGCGGGDQNIKVVKFRLPVIEAQRAALHRLRQRDCTTVGTIGNKDLPGPSGMKAAAGFLACIPGSEDHDLAAGKLTENLLGKIDGY